MDPELLLRPFLILLFLGLAGWAFRYRFLMLIADGEIAGDALEGTQNAIEHWKRWESYNLEIQKQRAMENLEQAIDLALTSGMGGYNALKHHFRDDRAAMAMFAHYDALPHKK